MNRRRFLAALGTAAVGAGGVAAYGLWYEPKRALGVTTASRRRPAPSPLRGGLHRRIAAEVRRARPVPPRVRP